MAAALREAYGRGMAWVSQDLIRRTILKEKDRPGGVNIGLIDQVARYSLDQGYHAVLDGILYADRYEQMLAGLRRDHRGASHFYYFNITMNETLRRHASRPQASEFGPEDMRNWYRPRDLLTSIQERIIPETSTLRQTVDLIEPFPLRWTPGLAARIFRESEKWVRHAAHLRRSTRSSR